MDEIAKKLAAIEWQYGDKDPASLAELRRRIEIAGARLQLITYSDLVRGVGFRIPSLNDGKPYEIRTFDWSGLDRRIVGDFLGFMCAEDYPITGFMPSALVVSKTDLRPSTIFFEWMDFLDVLPDTRQDTVLAFWADQVNKAHRWYSARDRHA